MSKKEVFILGAGFSYPAKLPLQNKLLEEILKNKDLEYLNYYAKIEEFLDYFFNGSFDLEDIFTILDRSYLYEENFSHLKWTDTYEIRKNLIFLIVNLIDRKLNDLNTFKAKYENFIKYICKNYKKVSVITLNWDTLLEKLVKNLCKNIMIDYCFYTYGLDNMQHIPHINLKAKGEKNLKIIKLHGSINWLFCPNCHRLIVDDKKIESIGKLNQKCKYCQDYSKIDVSLENFIVTPTILKKFDNLHLKYIWDNAFIELQEASKVTFIGYSLPKADYEFLYLLKKVLIDKYIKVVLAPIDKNSETHTRYEKFFKDVEFCFDGFEKCPI